MTTELDILSQPSALTLLPPAQHPAQAAIDMLRGHAEMMGMAYDLATKMCRTQLVPTRFRGKAEDAAAAILYGAELGLNPIQSLQRVVPIHGMPTLEARTMVALLKSRGYKIKTLEQSDEKVTVEGYDLDGERYVSQWTIERAHKAKYVPEIDEKTGKYRVNANGNLVGNEKYLTDPQAMLKAKAQAEVCRDMAPDVLLGISYSTEDIESEQLEQRRRPPTGSGSAEAITVEEIIGAAPVDLSEKANAPAERLNSKIKSATPPASSASAPQPGPAPEPPGAPTESTPGQTERVAQALGNARGQNPTLNDLLAEAGCKTEGDALAVASSILKHRIQDMERLTKSEQATIRTSLSAWRTVGTLAVMVANILDAADIQAEQAATQGAEQQTLDGEGNDSNGR